MKSVLKGFLRDETGTETVEWAILIAILAAVSIAILHGVREWVFGRITGLQNDLGAY